MHGGEGARGEGHLARSARHRQPVAHVVVGLLARQGRQVVAGGDALRELPQLAPSQHLRELRLADEDDLDELLGVGLEVGDEADLLEDLGREVLGLVDEQDHVPVLFARAFRRKRWSASTRSLSDVPSRGALRSSRMVCSSSAAVSAG